MSVESYTDDQLGFECDEQLRALISSVSHNESTNALLIQICRQNQKILDAIRKPVVSPIVTPEK